MAEYWGSTEETEFTLVEMSLSEQLLALARNVNDAIRDAMNAVNDFIEHNAEAVRQRSVKVRGFKNGAERVKDRIVDYLARLGFSLPLRDVYRQLVLQLDRIAQNSDAIAYRLSVVASERSVKLSNSFANKLRSMAQLVFNEYSTLLSSIRMLQENPRRSVDEAKKVMAIEEEIDQKYRELELDVITELKDDLLSLMLMREIIDLIEDTADTIKDAAENILFLALYKVSR
ncbi:DUF47 domain-containing protein [Pyrolobus fumarii]|uniref:DUF47 domain-containing protein n=1 Tax=Pyrolobus fumarii TaxID=54252 RepID=UPI00064EADFE|nr:DUF47 family protein [Pyrolobus fumarii]